jgi:hypothetical protein
MAVGAGIAMRAVIAKGKLERLDAFSEETAVKPEVIHENEWLLNHPYAKIRGIRRTADGRYFVESKK